MKSKTPFLLLIFSAPLFAQHLPTGTYRTNRERTYDIIHYKMNIGIDWKTKTISGESTIRLCPLGTASTISLDGYWLKVSSVRESPSGKELKFSTSESSVDITFSRTLQFTDTTTISVKYTAQPNAGLYFIDPPAGTTWKSMIFTYGEGGIHANWLPIYNEPNDKFSTEMLVTVAKPLTAISNGKLLETKDNADGTRTFHWFQQLPHSNYLIALFVGEYNAVLLRPAFGSIPLTAWMKPGTEEGGKNTFDSTPDMVEFFSNRFNYRYPWDKYDQISAYDYAIGAMENTGITGHNDRVPRGKNQTDGMNPDFTYFATNWTAESVTAHELAHHWFGDNLTCKSLSYIWLIESFASYCMMLWEESRHGKEYLQSQTWLALQTYLNFVRTSHIIRPLEYHYFDSREQIYNNETTYIKGAVVLHMLRWVMGDEDYFKALGYYLKKHEFTNVESSDLRVAIEEATGQNLQWFFDQWIHGGGHPTFEVTYTYLPDRKKIALNVNQVQPLVQGQGIFELPVEIRVDVKGKNAKKEIWVQRESDYFLIDVAGKPDLVSFDGRGALVCELLFPKDVEELIYQLQNDELPGRLWALRQLTSSFPTNPKTLSAIQSVLSDDSFWFLKAEAVFQLQNFHSPSAEKIVVEQTFSKEDHVRKASVIALGSFFTEDSRKTLRRVMDSDANDEITGTALVSLSKIDKSISVDELQNFLRREAWYDVNRIAVLMALQNLGDEKFLPIAREHASFKFNYEIRLQAARAWYACAPADPNLVNALLEFAAKDILPVRRAAFSLLAKMKSQKALSVLEEVVRRNGDSDIRKSATDAIEEIRRGL
ncbi:MAG: HEAT repeat domain-containing protein [Ignavibacteriales bacterium]|nr:HEAT repeat domain-containing protein [Ignavibacteriales bacterium]